RRDRRVELREAEAVGGVVLAVVERRDRVRRQLERADGLHRRDPAVVRRVGTCLLEELLQDGELRAAVLEPFEDLRRLAVRAGLEVLRRNDGLTGGLLVGGDARLHTRQRERLVV